ncbi:elongin C [Ciborinia camelliae]|nr:elongin C [Ciborinia camelliae]
MAAPSESKYVTLVSCDGFEFVVLREAACTSGAIKKMLDTTSSGIVLEKVAEYFYYNYKYRNSENVPDMEIPAELCLELLMAADYLDS